ncbi:helix-turn-helix transcriptional regulator [Natronincola ferrireducens]|uniref:Putative transcriptional regulator n=1 Tax=Natronincola ferrireducens TaxID=393762 RepID=A0A1G9I2E6_9FIRM|nr:helix-turn-helix transcriptional regulator [Natronincola ferrireducens]SDL19252.1 putative transcriptional regulator [Natronincola ferrireducens]
MRSKMTLKELRKKKKETQEMTAKGIGINRAVYSHYENGIRTPNVIVAKRIAEYFKVKIEDIFFISNDTISHKGKLA